MRVVDSAIWTSGDPVSFSPRLCSAISLPLTSFSTAKLAGKYTGRPSPGVFDGAVRTRIGPGAPLVRPVDHDRVGVAERVVSGRHQHHVLAAPGHLTRAWIVRLDGERDAVREEGHPW